MLCTVQAIAIDIVTSYSGPVKDMSQLAVGDKLLLFCNGPTDPNEREFGIIILCNKPTFINDVNIE